VRVAFFTPVSPQKTGIADYAEQEILPYLSGFCSIDIFIDKNLRPTNPSVTGKFTIYPYTEFPSRQKNYDILVYQMGNNPMHQFIYDTLIQYPGIVVLHDIFLHGFLWNRSLAKGDVDTYIDTFRYCYGEKGVTAALTAVETGVFPEFEYPLIKKIVDSSLGVICHSEYGVSLVLRENRHAIVRKIDQPFTICKTGETPDYLIVSKKDLELAEYFPIITSFGFIFSHKRYHVILRAFKKFLTAYPKAILVLVGEDMMNIHRMIADAGLSDSVILTGYVSQQKAQQYLDISDFCINLRYPTAGETSRSVLQLMAAGKPVIVSNVGWFAELPDDACLKVDVDQREEALLLEFMIALAEDGRFRDSVGTTAREYIVNKHDPEVVAREYCSFMDDILQGNAHIINTISQNLHEMGATPDDHALIGYAAARVKDLFS
jgi:glycosyltransferase involved in cell wall biosynthesis